MRGIGVDIGTTTISIVVVDCSSLLVERKYTVSNDSFLPMDTTWERIQDVQIILSTVSGILEEILCLYDDIASIGLTGQMHGIVYTDRQGSAASPLYTWQDGCGNLPVFDGRSICDILAEDYGVTSATGYGMVTYLYHSRKGLVPENAASFCTIGDYLGIALTRRTDPLVHISQAAGLGLYDHKEQDLMREVLVKNGANPNLVPCVTPDIVPLGTFHGIPVSVSLGDNQASFLGSVRNGADTVLVNVGTGAQISVLSDSYYSGNGIEARPLTKNLYLLVGASLCGGAAFAALERFFRQYAVAAGAPDIPQFEIMKHLLDQQSGQTEAWNVKTTFSGTREDPGKTGLISGIKIENFYPAALIRGVLNGMAKELRDLYRVLEEQVGITRSKLVASGNGIRRNEVLQIVLREHFGMPLTVEQNEEEAAFGAAVSALIMIGQVSLERWLGK